MAEIKPSTTVQPPTKLLKPKPPIRWLRWLLVVFILMGGLIYIYYAYPHQRIGPRQPIPFSHRIHAGVKAIDCRFCHPYVERSQNAGIPTVEKCFYCHEYIIPLHPEIKNERRYYDAREPMKWVEVFYVPDHVKFQHLPHIRWANLECARCHGAVERMDRLMPVEFKMKFCIDCHRQMKAQMDCWLACHH